MNKFKISRLPIYYQAWLVGGFFCIVLFISIILSLFTTPNTRENHAQLIFVNEIFNDIYQLAGIEGIKNKLNRTTFHHIKVIIVNNKHQPLLISKNSWHLPQEITPQLFSNNTNVNVIKLKKNNMLNEDVSFNYLVNHIKDKNRLIIIQRVTSINSELNNIPWQLWLFLLVFFFVGLSGIYVGLFVKKRLVNINNSCKFIIEQGDLSQRIQRDGSNKDFDTLAKNLNYLLSHIEQLIVDIKQVSDNIAHDLRTPLTKLQNKLEGANAKQLSSNKLIQFHQGLQQDLTSMNSIFNALLRISRIESNQNKLVHKSVDMHQLMTDVTEFYLPLAEEKHQNLSLSAISIELVGDRDLIFQAIANCLDNAIKYTPKNGNILITVTCCTNNLKVCIADDGIGIPKAEQAKVFQRLYRIDRSRSSSGTGLGLSLVKAIVENHQGTISIEDIQPGIIMCLTFPFAQC